MQLMSKSFLTDLPLLIVCCHFKSTHNLQEACGIQKKPSPLASSKTFMFYQEFLTWSCSFKQSSQSIFMRTPARRCWRYLREISSHQRVAITLKQPTDASALQSPVKTPGQWNEDSPATSSMTWRRSHKDSHSLSCASQSSEKLGRRQKRGSKPTQVHPHLFNWIYALCSYRTLPKSSIRIKTIISAADIVISQLFSLLKHCIHSKQTQN